MRAFGRDLIRGGHYGQRSCEPRQQAEHMAAPTNAAKREKSSCQLGAVHTWHNAKCRDVAAFGAKAEVRQTSVERTPHEPRLPAGLERRPWRSLPDRNMPRRLPPLSGRE